MEYALLSLPAWLSALLVIGGGIILSIGFMLATRRFVSQNLADMHNHVVGFVYAVLGVVYAVLLAFLVIAAWEQLGSADKAVTSEASTLSTLYRQTALVSPPARQQAQAELRRYTHDVIDDSFRTMRKGEESLLVGADLMRLYGITDQLTAQTPAQQIREEEFLRLLDELSSERSSRVAASREALDPILWWVLILGAVITIGFASLFYLDNLTMQAIIVGSVAVMLSSVLYLLLVVDHPFAGPIHVSADTYHIALEHMRR